MRILEKLKKEVLVYDGAMGTLLQAKGLRSGACPCEWNLTYPDKVYEIHKRYVQAGADIIETNTFGGNRLALEKYGLAKKCNKINHNAVKLAKKTGAFVAASVGPLPEMVEPLGRLTYEEALGIFKEQIGALSKAKPDLILLETFSDIKELKIAVIAAKEVSKIPIQAQLTYTETGTTISGTTPEVAVAVLEGLGVEIIGANCSLGPKELLPVIKRISQAARNTTYISVLPNAGLPELKNGRTHFRATHEEMALYSKKFGSIGVNLIGGCCGTTPAHIEAIAKKIKGKKPVQRKKRIHYLTTASRTQTVEFIPKHSPYIIGERINPSRRKILQQELIERKTKLIRQEALDQVKNGAHLLDINISTQGVDEINTMGKVVNTVQNTVSAPLVIDSANPDVLEAGLKQCTGKPIVNSVNGEREKLKKILPLVKKYGAAVIALAMDEVGIPMTAAKRVKIAQNIIKEAAKLGIRKEDILIDFLTLAVAAQPGSAKITLDAVNSAKKYGWQTLLGVSNVSFGLPDRVKLNSTFLAMAVKKGLTGAIINPIGLKIKETVSAKKMLLSKKPIILKIKEKIPTKTEPKTKEKNLDKLLYQCILTGDKDNVSDYITESIKSGKDALSINHSILIPALSEVGKKFECKEYFLPQLLLSAETMQIAVKTLEKSFPKTYKEGKAKVLMATVKGDLHDIGKNIVSSVLKNYGYIIIDLGKNISSSKVVKIAKEKNVDIIGLSALMTTSMGQMEIIINELKKHRLCIPTIIGGAVVTETYAKKIGASGYAKDAVSAVNEVKRILKK